MKKICMTFCLIAFLSISAYSAATESILVAGFRNIGSESDDNINIADEIAHQPSRGFTGREGRDLRRSRTDDAHQELLAVRDVQYGRHRERRTPVRGQQGRLREYKVDAANETITITYSVYDVPNDRVMMTRTLEGRAGLDIFDTIDALAKKAAVAIVGATWTTTCWVSTYRDAGATAPSFSGTMIIPSSIALSLGAGLFLQFYSFNNELQIY
jgi:hypothetical protein